MTAEIILCGFLGLLSLEDIKRQEISLWLLGAAAGIGLIVLASQTFSGWMDLSFRLLPGAALLLIAVLSKGKVGAGDGMVFLMIGLYCSLGQVLGLMAGSFLVSGVVAVVLTVIKRKEKTDTFPFVPCIFAVCLTWFVLHRMGLCT